MVHPHVHDSMTSPNRQQHCDVQRVPSERPSARSITVPACHEGPRLDMPHATLSPSQLQSQGPLCWLLCVGSNHSRPHPRRLGSSQILKPLIRPMLRCNAPRAAASAPSMHCWKKSDPTPGTTIWTAKDPGLKSPCSVLQQNDGKCPHLAAFTAQSMACTAHQTMNSMVQPPHKYEQQSSLDLGPCSNKQHGATNTQIQSAWGRQHTNMNSRAARMQDPKAGIHSGSSRRRHHARCWIRQMAGPPRSRLHLRVQICSGPLQPERHTGHMYQHSKAMRIRPMSPASQRSPAVQQQLPRRLPATCQAAAPGVVETRAAFRRPLCRSPMPGRRPASSTPASPATVPISSMRGRMRQPVQKQTKPSSHFGATSQQLSLSPMPSRQVNGVQSAQRLLTLMHGTRLSAAQLAAAARTHAMRCQTALMAHALLQRHSR